jgi:hypothetical protein
LALGSGEVCRRGHKGNRRRESRTFPRCCPRQPFGPLCPP